MAGMFDFKKMLSVARRADATSADVQTALVKAKAAAEAARGDIAEAKDRYIRGLLEDDFQASVKAKESEARAEIERDRAHALIEVLEKQLSEALAREQQAADAITAEIGRKAAVEYRRIIEEIYAPAAKAAAEALAKLPELQKKIHAANQLLPDCERIDPDQWRSYAPPTPKRARWKRNFYVDGAGAEVTGIIVFGADGKTPKREDIRPVSEWVEGEEPTPPATIHAADLLKGVNLPPVSAKDSSFWTGEGRIVEPPAPPILWTNGWGGRR